MLNRVDKSSLSTDNIRLDRSKETVVTDSLFSFPVSPHEDLVDASYTMPEIDCTNIQQIVIGKKLGIGKKRATYAGEFYGKKVAVKVVLPGAPYVRQCLKNQCMTLQDCYSKPYKSIVDEILLHRQLKHRGIVPLLGYCVKDTQNPPDPKIPITKRGAVSVFQLGEKYSEKNNYTVTQRLHFALDLADVLDYLSKSPLGSFLIKDLNRPNVVLLDGKLTLSDIEYSTSEEPRCMNGTCRYDVKCINGECKGSNAIEMMEKAYIKFFPYLLKVDSSDELIREGLTNLLSSLKTLSLTAAQLKQSLRGLLNIIREENTPFGH